VSRAEEARRLRADGFTVLEICERMGIKRNWYYSLLSVENYRRRTDRARDRKSRRAGKRRYLCSVCDQPGHNARRHRRQ